MHKQSEVECEKHKGLNNVEINWDVPDAEIQPLTSRQKRMSGMFQNAVMLKAMMDARKVADGPPRKYQDARRKKNKRAAASRKKNRR